jgi:thiol-disulfide isomerase/thioredoxin
MNLEASSTDILLRLVLALAVSAGGILAYRLFNRMSLVRLRLKAVGPKTGHKGTPALLYFTTPGCAPCKTVQRPAIQQLKEQVGDRIEVIEIDASTQPEVASQWGVLSVPTTFILDAEGQPRYVNHGIASVDKLLRQFRELN